jgi:stage V sporulation protein G
MRITEVKIKIVDGQGDKLLAFASLTFDHEFVVRDLKIIRGNRGYFVAMPSRKVTCHCPRCDSKNHLRAAFCNDCGAELPTRPIQPDINGRARLHADVAHPITASARDYIQNAVVEAFLLEVDRFCGGELRSSHDDGDAGPD